jgi:hypothetical protein
MDGLFIIHGENEGCVTISGIKPACDRLDTSKLIEIWVVIANEKNKWNMIVDHISNVKHIY